MRPQFDDDDRKIFYPRDIGGKSDQAHLARHLEGQLADRITEYFHLRRLRGPCEITYRDLAKELKLDETDLANFMRSNGGAVNDIKLKAYFDNTKSQADTDLAASPSTPQS